MCIRSNDAYNTRIQHLLRKLFAFPTKAAQKTARIDLQGTPLISQIPGKLLISLEGDESLLGGEPKAGLYDCTISVTNSVGDKTSLPVQVEIYVDSYEERSLRPSITLKENLVYLKKGEAFDPNTYLDYVNDGSVCRIDYGPMISVFENNEWKDVTEQIANGSELGWVNISQIGINSNVDTNTPGTYNVVYTYTAPKTGYDCTAHLMVVIE